MVAIVTADMVLVESYSGGTGALEVGSTVAGFLAPGSQIASGARAVWRCASADYSQWEEFVGTYSAGSPNTVSRDTLLLRSDSGSGFINWTSGQKKLLFPVVASRYLPLLDDGLKMLPAQLPDSPYSILRSSATVQLGNDTAQTLTWDVNGGNTLGGIDPGASVWSAIVLGSGGLYSLRAAVSFSAGGGTYRELRIVVNGGIYAQKRRAPMSAGETVLDVAVDLGVGANSLVVVQALQNSGAALAVGGTTWTHFSAVRQI